MLFDKTGTLTYGNPQVAQTIYYSSDRSLAESLLASVERESDHPLAKAIVKNYSGSLVEVIDSTEVVQGGGVVAHIQNHQVLVGNSYLMNQYNIPFTNQMKSDIAGMEAEGNSIVLTAIDGQIALIVGIRDQIRQGVKEDLETLKNMGVKNLILLSGDNQGTVDLVASQLGLTEAYGHLLPEDKAEFVRKRQASGEIVAFVGDGINDSPSLALADIGIAMGNGTDVAIETSNVVLMNSDFHRIPHAIGLAKATRHNMIENIFISLLVVVVLLISVLSSSWMNILLACLFMKVAFSWLF